MLAGEASAKFSLLLGDHAAFDCRISQLPRVEDVVDYFRWRNEDAHRNALNGHCYWLLRQQGKSATEATNLLARISVAKKHDLLFQPCDQFQRSSKLAKAWSRLVLGDDSSKEAINLLTGEGTTSIRRRIKVEFDLPMRDRYSEFIQDMLRSNLSGD